MDVSRFIIDDPRTREEVEDATCTVCKKIAIDPTQCRLAHLFCSVCIAAHLATSRTCPATAHDLSHADLFPNPLAERIVSRLTIRCKNTEPPVVAGVRKRLHRQSGCPWSGRVRDLPTHETDCPFRTDACPVCGDDVPLKGMDNHVRECRRAKSCDLCHTEVDCLEDHYDLCQAATVYCPNHCVTGDEVTLVRRGDVDQHLRVCPRQTETCEFCEFGCDFKGERARVRKHAKEDLAKHVSLLRVGMKRARDLLRRVESIEERLRVAVPANETNGSRQPSKVARVGE